MEQIISADGFAAAPDGSLDFFQLPGDFDSTDPGQMAMLQHVDAILLGANTYRMFSAYWPTADESTDAVAGPINASPSTWCRRRSTLRPGGCGPRRGWSGGTGSRSRGPSPGSTRGT
ncbi:hypothetical protein ACFDTO_11360 [Microbacteriaceae bacterium 4G12]